jgi:hypothetical protein
MGLRHRSVTDFYSVIFKKQFWGSCKNELKNDKECSEKNVGACNSVYRNLSGCLIDMQSSRLSLSEMPMHFLISALNVVEGKY